MALQQWQHLDTCAHIPNSNGPALRLRDNFGSIEQECNRRPEVTVALQWWQHLHACDHIPNLMSPDPETILDPLGRM